MKPGRTWPAAEAPAGRADRLPAAASPGSQTGRLQSAEARGCPPESGRASHCCSPAQAVRPLRERKCVLGFNRICFLVTRVDCVSGPLWRCWEEIALEKSRKRRRISCRVLNSGDVLTSSERSWSLPPGAALCKWSAGEINTPHRGAKQSYLL